MVESTHLKFEHFSVELIKPDESCLLKTFVSKYQTNIIQQASDQSLLVIENTSMGLELQWNKQGERALNYFIDVEKLTKSLRSYPAAKQGAFNQALGKKTRHIIDATGGWGGDALLMCMQGYQVTVLERNPVMALLLCDAMQRLAKTVWAIDNEVVCPTVEAGDAQLYFSKLETISGIDCVYLDPMFPPKKKKSAATNKYMQLLHWMVGADSDSSQLLELVLQKKVNRVAVKRPDYAEPLLKEPSQRFSSKLVHYDVYLSS